MKRKGYSTKKRGKKGMPRTSAVRTPKSKGVKLYYRGGYCA